MVKIRRLIIITIIFLIIIRIIPTATANGLNQVQYDNTQQLPQAAMSVSKNEELLSSIHIIDESNYVYNLNTPFTPLSSSAPLSSPPYREPPYFYDGFELGFPGTDWDVTDINSDNGSDYWDDVNTRSKTGFRSLYCSDIGDVSSSGHYDNNMSAFATLKTFDTRDFKSMNISFDIWYETEANIDHAAVIASANGATYFYISEKYNGTSTGWESYNISIPPVFFTSSFSVGFYFESDEQNNSYEGVYIDRVGLRGIVHEPWTVITYMAGDHNLASDMLNDTQDMLRASSISNFQVVILYDGDEADDSWAARICENSAFYINLTEINSSWGDELDTSDPDVLIEFVKYAIYTHPSDRIFLSLDDHGGSFLGCCWDLTTNSSWGACLTLDDLNYSLSEIKKINGGQKIELLQYSACLMGAMEVFYQTYPYANYTLASEKVSYSGLINYTHTFNHMESAPSENGEKLGKFIITDSITQYSSFFSVTLSLINNTKVAALVTSLENFVSALNTSLVRYFPYIYNDRADTDYYEGPTSGDPEQIIDLYHFAQKVNQDSTLPSTMRTAAQNLMTAINNAVAHESHQTGSMGGSESTANAHGISIYMPGDYDIYWNYYSNWQSYSNDFTSATNWDEFLARFLSLSEWDLYENDDSWLSATPIPTNLTCQWHSLDDSTDVDWISFEADKGYEYTIETTNLSFNANTKITLYDTDGSTLLAMDDDSGTGTASKIVWDCPESGTYYAKIDSIGTGYGPKCWYDISISNDTPILWVSTHELNFSYMNIKQEDSLTFDIINNNVGSLYWGISESYSWLGVTPPNGVNTGTLATVTITVNTWGQAEQFYSAELTINSNVGSTNLWVNATVDATQPNLTITSPQDNFWTDETSLKVKWTSSDLGAGIDHYELQINNGSWIDNGLTTEYTFTDLVDGSHLVNVTSIDKVLNKIQASVTLNIDRTPPNLEITNPKNEDYIKSDSVIINWHGEDVGVGIDGYEIKLDNGPWKPTMFDNSHKFDAVPDGQHTVKLKAIDSLGYFTESEVQFYIDTTSPTIVVTSPENNSWIGDTKVRVTWTYADTVSGVEKVIIELDNDTIFDMGINTSYILTDLTEGQHYVKVIVSDKLLNKNEQLIIINVDITPPELTIDKPEEAQYLSSEQVTVEWTSNDVGSGIKDYEIKLDNFALQTGYSKTFYSLLALTDGKHTISIKSTDMVGNSNTETVKFYIDSTNPAVSVSKPKANSTITKSSVKVDWAGFDEGAGLDRYEIKLDSGEYIDIGINTSYSFTNLNNGTHEISLKAVDEIGNERIIFIPFIVELADENVGNGDGDVNGDGDGIDDSDNKKGEGGYILAIAGVIVIIIVIVIILVFLLTRKKKPYEAPEDHPTEEQPPRYRERPREPTAYKRDQRPPRYPPSRDLDSDYVPAEPPPMPTRTVKPGSYQGPPPSEPMFTREEPHSMLQRPRTSKSEIDLDDDDEWLE